MTHLKPRVRNDHLVLDAATDLPEGTVVRLVPVDWWDDLDEENRRRLEKSLARSESDVQEGRVFPLDVILNRLRRQA